MNEENKYYVYVYIDPRDYSEFYYGKGIKDRKYSHLDDDKDSEKTKIINEIKKEGLDPIIKVVAKDLSEEQAFLVEKTLIWKLGRNLANISSGHYSEKFRPHKSLHKDIWGFDYNNGIYFFNCGDSGENGRSWEDFKKHGFITAGGAPKYSDPIRTFEIGDIACVYLSKHGYVGIAKIKTKAVISHEFKINGEYLNESGLDHYNNRHQGNEDKEYMCEVEWVSTLDRKDAFFKKKSKMFSPISVKASMQQQGETIRLISDHFKVDLYQLLETKNAYLQHSSATNNE